MSAGGDQPEHRPHDIRMLVKRQVKQVLVAHEALVVADASPGSEVRGDFHTWDVVELGITPTQFLAVPPERRALDKPTRKP